MTREKAFRDVMEKQSNYKFLGHDEIAMSSKEKKREVMAKINAKIDKMKSAMYYFGFILIMALGLSLTSCEKEAQEQLKRQMITQSFILETVTGYDITKSFDPQTWVYNYSNTQYELKLQSTDGQYTYTKMVSVNEMLSGSISFQMFSGVYNVTYTPVHSPRFSTVLDVAINMTDVQISGSPVILEGELEDALIIFDRADVFPVIDEEGTPVFYNDSRGFWFAYVHAGFSVKLVIQATGVQIPITLSNPNMGKVYWYAQGLVPNVQLNIPAMTIERLTF
jgi:hypothetical protein